MPIRKEEQKMSREAKISFLGLLNWDPDLFSLMSWPDAFLGDSPALNKDAFLQELLAQTAELEVLYTSPNFMKNMIGIWSKTRLPIWNALYETTTYEYNPIENYDRTETGQDVDTHSGTDRHTNTLTREGTDTTTDTPHMEHFIAAYNSAAAGDNDGLVKSNRDDGENVSEIEYDSSDTNNGSVTHGHKIVQDHALNVHGNIGVVTSQEMIRQQREVVEFNMYDRMINDFRMRFCVLVY